MTDTEGLFWQNDRIAKIRSVLFDVHTETRWSMSFSGGKDSMVLHHLLDLAVPGNDIPRVYVDTGIEYQAMRLFVKSIAENDSRIKVVKPSVNIMEMLTTKGYPFKSKQHSEMLRSWQYKGIVNKSIARYLGKPRIKGDTRFTCPKVLRYQFESRDSLPFKVSPKCCDCLKKKPLEQYQIDHNLTGYITGVRKAEGGQRVATHCLTDTGDMVRFNPLLPVSGDWENWYINYHGIKLCELYYPPYNLSRTGCAGCPFAIDLQANLDTLKEKLPTEYKKCERIWKPVYQEYRRIGYRLKPE